MDSSTVYLLIADAILLLHVSFVIFVIIGLILILVGKIRNWSWIRNFWFRVAHLTAIGIVVVQSWLGVICPLTSLEMALRSRAGVKVYSSSFISHWVENLLYYHAPPWLFIVCYTIFGALIVGSWFWVRPRRFHKLNTTAENNQSVNLNIKK